MAINPRPVAATESVVLDRLISFEVEGLFGEYNYRIPVNVVDRVTAIIAPNGSGKTICLRLIAALFAKQWSFFSELEFNSAKYSFKSGRQVTIRRDRTVDPEASNKLGIFVAVTGPDQKPVSWRPGSP